MSIPQDITATIVENKRVGPEIFLLSLKGSDAWTGAEPGQFAMLKIADTLSNDPLLRRPLSIHNVTGGKIQFLYKVTGRGTHMLAQAMPGTPLRILVPLGIGYVVSGPKTHCLVGGGMGIAPLLYLAHTMRERHPTDSLHILLGARTKEEILSGQEFKKAGLSVLKIATDDGSAGHFGLVTDLLEEMKVAAEEMAVYCCGPEPMMKAVSRICLEKGWQCQVSLEALMACGMGACLGCAVRKKGLGLQEYLHVCSDGPVFRAEEIW